MRHINQDEQWQQLQQLATIRAGINVAPVGTAFFLTGATGFLGGWLVHDLSKRTTKPIYCLVRAATLLEAKRRLKKNLCHYGLNSSLVDDGRVMPVLGDLSKSRLGLSDSLWHELIHAVGVVIHSAAVINSTASYQKLYIPNVQGSMHVLEFCLAGAKKQLHYLSSLSVFVDTDHNTGLLKETDSIQLAKQVYGGYAQSKWAAEYVVSSLPREVCIVSIYRLGLICGDTQSGRLPGKDILSLFLQDASRQKTLPYDHDETMAMDVTPVDTASNIITQLIMHGIKSDTGYIYHIANPQSLRWNQLAGFLKQSIHRSAYGTSNGWTQYALCRLSEHAEDYQQFRHMDLFKATKVTFDMQQTKRVIGAVFFPLPTQALINKYIKSACSDQVTLVTSREENHEIYSNTTPS